MGQVYLSYSQDDRDSARKIRDTLQAWGHIVWMDDPDEAFDKSLADQIEQALRDCQVFVALLSPASVKSRTVRREIAIAKSLDKPIIPVMVEPLPTVSESERSKYIDATENPGAAMSKLVKAVDARIASAPAVSPQTTGAAEKSVNRRPISPLLLVGGVVAALILVALLLFAISQSNLARQQEAEAANARGTAAAAQSTADALVLTQTAIAVQPPTQIIPPSDRPTSESTLHPETPEATETAVDTTEASPTPTAILEETAPASTAAIKATDTPASTVKPSTPANEPTSTVEEDTSTPHPSFTPTSTIINTSTPTRIPVTQPPTPTINLTQAQASNLLTNPGFESFSSTVGGQVAQAWQAWSITQGDNLPSYQLAPVFSPAAPNQTRIRSGINAQQYTSSYTTHDGGLYQRVTGITPGTTLRFSVMAYVWSSNFADVSISEEDGDVMLQVGIDPTGGTDPQSANIIWSAPVEQYDTYHEYVVIATATASSVTVFVRSTVDFPVQNTVVYLDDALLIAIG